MRCLFIFLAVFLTCGLKCQGDSVALLRVYFLYGSKPKFKFRHAEQKEFGGLHGGHVSLQVNGFDYGFERSAGFHIIPRSKNYRAKFLKQASDSVLPKHTGSKTLSIFIPLTAAQYQKLNEVHAAYCEKVPYDYAFFGMRCAASVREILGQTGIMKTGKRSGYIASVFYPKRLRKKLLRLACENNYDVVRTVGRSTRKWEKD